jgi:hypothetical protein
MTRLPHNPLVSILLALWLLMTWAVADLFLHSRVPRLSHCRPMIVASCEP